MKMLKLLCILVFSFNTLLVVAQPYRLSLVPSDPVFRLDAMEVIEEGDHTLFVGNYRENIHLTEIEGNGTPVQTVEYSAPNYTTLSNAQSIAIGNGLRYTGGSASGNDHAMILATEPAGSVVWSKAYGRNYIKSLLFDNWHNEARLIALGQVGNPQKQGDQDLVLMWIIPDDGTLKIAKRLGTFGINSQYAQDIPAKVIQNEIGYLVVAQTEDRFVNVIQLNYDFEIVWQHTYLQTFGSQFIPEDIAIAAQGEVIAVTGTYRTAWSADKGFLLRLDPAGNVMNCLLYHIESDPMTRINAITTYETALGSGFLLAGVYQSGTALNSTSAFVLNVDLNGNPIWTNTYDEEDRIGNLNDIIYSKDTEQFISVGESIDNGDQHLLVVRANLATGEVLEPLCSQRRVTKVEPTWVDRIDNLYERKYEKEYKIEIKEEEVKFEPLYCEGVQFKTPNEEFSSTVTTVTNTVSKLSNQPNPFRETTTIRFELEEANKIELTVYDLNGKPIFQKEIMATEGLNEVEFQATDLPNGMYFYQLETPQQTLRNTMLIID